MKSLLTSASITNTSIRKAPVDLLGKPLSEAIALGISTAGFGHSQGSPSLCARA